jgi:hypothetical protein
MRRLGIVLVLAGCNVVFGFDDIQPVVDAGIDAPPPAPPPHVTATPGPLGYMNMGFSFFYPGPVDVTIAADQPGTMIAYTTDGTAPIASSPGGPSPVTVTLMVGPTTLSYVATTTGGSDTGGDVYHFDPATAKSNAGYVVTSAALDGAAPIAVVAPGQVVHATAHVQFWNQTGGNNFTAQLVYGVDQTDQGCLIDAGLPLFPGVSQDVMVDITAPTGMGVHDVNVADTEQTSCASAMGMMSLQTRPNLTRIAVLVVQ